MNNNNNAKPSQSSRLVRDTSALPLAAVPALSPECTAMMQVAGYLRQAAWTMEEIERSCEPAPAWRDEAEDILDNIRKAYELVWKTAGHAAYFAEHPQLVTGFDAKRIADHEAPAPPR